jgi:hypothetical protein
VYAVWLQYSVLLEEGQDLAVEVTLGYPPQFTMIPLDSRRLSARESDMHGTKGEMQQIMASSLDLRE